MRVLYIDIDTLRADHLGCYGYHRDTSPNIDAIAAGGVRLEQCYTSDSPCLPSRSSLVSGRFGIHHGAIGHGGVAAEPFSEGPRRGFQTLAAVRAWPRLMRGAGLWTASISSFADRHSAAHWNTGFNEVHNVGLWGLERADQVTPAALDWLNRHGQSDDWFLHVHFWDPHTPYRTPDQFGEPFESDPLPDWITEEVRAGHWGLPGPHSAQEMGGFSPGGMFSGAFARQPEQASDLAQVRRMFDGYDTGIRYADHHAGRLLGQLEELGVLDETAVIVSSDHGETLGELGVYGDHHTADEHVHRVPLVMRWPGVEGATGGKVRAGFHYQIDVAATALDLLGAGVPRTWDGASFAGALRDDEASGREHLVLSHAAWTAQRSVRFDDFLCVFTYHDGYHGYPDAMVFDLATDPHEQHDLSAQKPGVVAQAQALLAAWHEEQMGTSTSGVDPIDSVLDEGGPWHVRGHLPAYLDRLRETGRGAWADLLAASHPQEAAGG